MLLALLPVGFVGVVCWMLGGRGGEHVCMCRCVCMYVHTHTLHTHTCSYRSALISAVAQAGARILAAYVILTAGASWHGKMELWAWGCFVKEYVRVGGQYIGVVE